MRSWKSAVAAVVALAGCVSAPAIPEAERLEAPRPCFSRAPLASDDALEPRAYSLPARLADVAGVETFVHVALHPAAWQEPAATICRMGGSLLVVAAPEVHERVARLLKTLERAHVARWRLSVEELSISCETASTLGPLEAAWGSTNLNGPLLRVPLTRAATERLERLGVTDRAASRGVAGEWVSALHILQRAYIQDLEFPQEKSAAPGRSCAPTVGVLNKGFIAFGGVTPLEDGNLLLAFWASLAAELPPRTVVTRAYGDRTVVPLELPVLLCREGEDAVVLGPGESLALLAPAADPDRMHVILLKPELEGS
jgi:hypothetical protein